MPCVGNEGIDQPTQLQSDQGLQSLLTESMDTVGYIDNQGLVVQN